MIIAEEWKDVKGYEGFYKVSNTGKVKSLGGKRGGHLKDIIMKQFLSHKNYWRLQLQVNKKKKTIEVHRLVAQAFLPNPNNYPQINHKDGDKLNNNVDNLEWCTKDYNLAHARKNWLHNYGERNGSKLKECHVVQIRSIYPKLTQLELAKLYGVSRSNINNILNRWSWRHI